MRILIAGGSGFLGRTLQRELGASGHEVRILTRSQSRRPGAIQWDGRRDGAWTAALRSSEAVVNACGLGLDHWPWTAARKREFVASRVEPGRALTAAIAKIKSRPRVFVQFSGISRYGLDGTTPADETTPAAGDFLAQLTVLVEAATEPLEAIGMRRVVVRNAMVLDAHQGLFPLMSLPTRMLLGGRFGGGGQAVPWIHASDHCSAVRFLLEDEGASGAYNLVAPTPTTNAQFIKAICAALHRPYWLHFPAFILRLVLGEMSVLALDGRVSQPRRLLEAGFQFQFPTIEAALRALIGGRM